MNTPNISKNVVTVLGSKGGAGTTPLGARWLLDAASRADGAQGSAGSAPGERKDIAGGDPFKDALRKVEERSVKARRESKRREADEKAEGKDRAGEAAGGSVGVTAKAADESGQAKVNAGSEAAGVAVQSVLQAPVTVAEAVGVQAASESMARSGAQGVEAATRAVKRAERLGTGEARPEAVESRGKPLDDASEAARSTAPVQAVVGESQEQTADRDADGEPSDGGGAEAEGAEVATSMPGGANKRGSADRASVLGNLPVMPGAISPMKGGGMGEAPTRAAGDARAEVWSLSPTGGKAGENAKNAAANDAGTYSRTAPVEQQVAEGLTAALRHIPSPSGQRVVTIRLEPLDLGSVRVQMRVAGDSVAVRFQVGTAAAQTAVARSVQELRESVQRRGLRVESLSVELDAGLAPAEAVDGPTAGGGAAGTPLASESEVEARAERVPGVPSRSASKDLEGGVLETLTLRLDQVA